MNCCHDKCLKRVAKYLLHKVADQQFSTSGCSQNGNALNSTSLFFPKDSFREVPILKVPYFLD